MSLISQRFSSEKLLIPYIMAGFPSLPTSKKIVETLINAGCSVIEIGVPYSDPLADGPTIQRASEAALADHVDTEDVFSLIKEVKEKLDFSPVLMVYYNLVYRYGLEEFAAKAAEAGVEGLIIPDLTIEEAGDWKGAAGRHGIDTIFLVAPTSSEERIRKITAGTSGFIYCVSLTGVTGARQALPPNLLQFIKRVRDKTNLPLAVGFGISSLTQAREVADFADGIIIGSAIIDIIERAATDDEAVATVGKFAAQISEVIKESVKSREHETI